MVQRKGRIIRKGNFNMYVNIYRYLYEKNPYIILERNNVRYEINIGSSAIGNRTRILNLIKNLDKKILDYKKELEDNNIIIEN